MPSSAPIPLASAFPEPDRTQWHHFHRLTMGRMTALAGALDRQDWAQVHQTCQWVQDTFQPHQEAEERALFPFLARAGAGELRDQLRADHREIRDLNQGLLQAAGSGRIPDPGSHGQRARRLLNLVREHIDAEEHLPLLPPPADTTPGRSAGASGCPECEPRGRCSGSIPDPPAAAAPG